MATAYIALGSNLGDREKNLKVALARLASNSAIRAIRTSSFHETDPVGGPPDQGKYLNAAAQLETDLSARDLLNELLGIERQLGRVRSERFGPRTIDLDLLLYGHEVIHEDVLTVPHPRMHERSFVLVPLAEIAPLAVHPVLQSTVADLLKRLQGQAMTRELTGLKALVTGATSGIGKAIALELTAGGADVLVHGRSRDRAEAAVAHCQAQGGRAEFVLADLSEERKLSGVVDQAWRTWDGLDIWINNAGADTLTGTAGKMPFEKKLEELWSVDVQATMLLSRAVGQRMKTRGCGVILTMGWDQAETGMEGDSGQLFAASKAAIMAFTKSLALTLAPQVRVNCLAPGWIRTAWGEQASPSWQERAIRETPLSRWGTPEDVAKTARWLVSPTAAFITGQIIRVNGGAVRG